MYRTANGYLADALPEGWTGVQLGGRTAERPDA
jgi:hypothetical protein